MLPNFLLIGPGRSGSDWITKNLQLHPEIFIPQCKGTRYFADCFDKGLPWYEEHFDGRLEKAIGETSVEYLAWAEAPERIAKLIPQAKLVATLRHPVDRAFSSYGRLSGVAKPGAAISKITFEEKIEKSPELFEKGFYAKHLRQYLSSFPRDQILVLLYDDMVVDPRGYLKEIYRFLGVDDSFGSSLLDQRLNATETYHAKSKLGYLAYRAALRLNLFGLSKRIRSAIRVDPPKIDPRTRERLTTEVFLTDIEDLEGLIDRDLSAWKAK